jgi:hypothetical protein
MLDTYAAHAMIDRGDVDGAIERLRESLDTASTAGNIVNLDVQVAVLAELLLARGTEPDLSEAEAAIDLCTRSFNDDAWAQRDMTTLRFRALLARARGDEKRYREFKDRYRTAAQKAGFPAHVAIADAMP